METSFFYALLSLPFLLIAFKYLSNSKTKLPPTPFPSLPLLGHLHLLKFPLHRTFLSLSQKHGPIFSLRLGTRLAVVVSSPAIAEECFTKNDIVLANRPRFIIGKYIGYNYTSLVGAPYGDYWRNLRRLTTVEIFSSSRLNAFQSIRHDEVRLMLEKLYRKSGPDNFARVEIRSLLSELTFNNIMRMVAGKRYFGVDEANDGEEAENFRELIKEVFSYGGVSNVADFFPVLRWFDYKGVEKNLARIAAQMDASLQALVDEQRRRNDGNTMISHLLALQDSDPEYYTEEIIKCIIVMMLLVGTDTSSVTVEWAMSALLNHPEKMEKAREEIDRVVGKDRLLHESDLQKLPYLQNIISETLRLFPAAPMLVPHEASSHCKIAGYDVPRGTILMVNAWAIHRDPSVWDDPERFEPERFEGRELGPPKMLAFGMGRRACPGSGLAHRVVGLALGCLIQCFHWERVDERLVDLSEGKGASMPKNVPFVAKCRASFVGQRLLGV
ncbi:cytochrome P450 81Q32-like [Salvia miltiorrhiza]|uniref:cytochrome P450 81Q32-like n=1 Tax=Salvia miltiorrhiza TaxID=226208 RepID=UPI0025AC2DEE|nr:cytochrome P450 81Q32-like [Salvia miltiorrhiza]